MEEDMAIGGNGLFALRSQYLNLLTAVLGDLDKNGLTDLALLQVFNSAGEALQKTSGYQEDRELVELTEATNEFLAIVIRSMRQDGEHSKGLRKRINELLTKLVDVSYHPV